MSESVVEFVKGIIGKEVEIKMYKGGQLTGKSSG